MTGIRDLARHLNISIGTVSRALNDRPGVNLKTKTRVLKAAGDLGYVPNQAGRSLRKGNTNVVGFVLEIDNQGMMQGDLFFVRVLEGMQSVLSGQGLNLVTLLSPSSMSPEEYLKEIVARRFTDGLVLSATRRNDPRISFLAKQNLPFVTLGRSLTDGRQPWFDLDFDGMIADAVGRLAANGHTHIALALPPTDLNLRYLMLEAYQKNLAKYGIDFDDRLLVDTKSGEEGGVVMVRQLVEMTPRPSAIIYSDPILPFGLYRGLGELGLTPGKDLSIIGIGTRLASLLTPNLTHYRFNLFELGVKTAEALVETMVDGQLRDPGSITRQCVPFSVVEGESIGKP